LSTVGESTEIGNRFITIMRNYEERVKEAGSGFHMNPSPGNVKDGLITDAIKSAGAARKGGTSPVVDVFDYPGWVKKDGLHFCVLPAMMLNLPPQWLVPEQT
jgi:altronate hydrolase